MESKIKKKNMMDHSANNKVESPVSSKKIILKNNPQIKNKIHNTTIQPLGQIKAKQTSTHSINNRNPVSYLIHFHI